MRLNLQPKRKEDSSGALSEGQSMRLSSGQQAVKQGKNNQVSLYLKMLGTNDPAGKMNDESSSDSSPSHCSNASNNSGKSLSSKFSFSLKPKWGPGFQSSSYSSMDLSDDEDRSNSKNGVELQGEELAGYFELERGMKKVVTLEDSLQTLETYDETTVGGDDDDDDDGSIMDEDDMHCDQEETTSRCQSTKPPLPPLAPPRNVASRTRTVVSVKASPPREREVRGTTWVRCSGNARAHLELNITSLAVVAAASAAATATPSNSGASPPLRRRRGRRAVGRLNGNSDNSPVAQPTFNY